LVAPKPLSKKAQCPLKRGADLFIITSAGYCSRNHNAIACGKELLVEAKKLPDHPLYAISLDRAPDAPRHRDPEPLFLGRQNGYCNNPRARGDTTPANRAILLRAF